MAAPSSNDLRALIEKWRAYEATPSNVDDAEDIGFANGTEWGLTMAARDLKQLLESYGA